MDLEIRPKVLYKMYELYKMYQLNQLYEMYQLYQLYQLYKMYELYNLYNLYEMYKPYKLHEIQTISTIFNNKTETRVTYVIDNDSTLTNFSIALPVLQLSWRQGKCACTNERKSDQTQDKTNGWLWCHSLVRTGHLETSRQHP
jgi:hypothetical protein